MVWGAFLHSSVWLWPCVSLSWPVDVPLCGHVAVVVDSTLAPMTVAVDEKCSCGVVVTEFHGTGGVTL